MRLPLAALVALCTVLLAADCELPFGPEEGHTILYLHVLPAGSSFVYPAEEELEATAEAIRDYFFEVSYGQVRLQGDGDPSLPGDVVGPLLVSSAFACDSEQRFVHDALSELALVRQFDFSPYEHLVVIAPGVGCSFNGQYVGALALPLPGGLLELDPVYANAQTIYYTGNGSSGPPVIAHEIGHQLGLVHSRALRCSVLGVVFDAGCDDGEYLDLIDVMGTSVFFGHYNAWQKRVLGWLPDASVLEVTESGRYLLTPFESRSLGPKMLLVRRQADSWLTVEYRTPTGFDAQAIPGFTDGAVVRLVRPLDTSGGGLHSFLIAGPAGRFALVPGESIEDVRGHRVGVVARTSGGILLDVEVPPAAETQPPSLSVSLAPAGPERIRVTVHASDPSGIDRVEVYGRRSGVSRFDWTATELLGGMPGGGATSFEGSVDVDFAGVDTFEVVAFDLEGNVARDLR